MDDDQTFVKKDQGLFTFRQNPFPRLKTVQVNLVVDLVCLRMRKHFRHFDIVSLSMVYYRVLMIFHSHVKTVQIFSFCLSLIRSFPDLLNRVLWGPTSGSLGAELLPGRPLGVIVFIFAFQLGHERARKLWMHLVILSEQILAIL